MKRTPLVRRTPLARGATPLKRTRLRPVSARQRRKASAWAEVGRQLDTQGRTTCEARVADGCTGRREHKHHILPRSNGGRDELANCLPVCHVCHEHLHRNPAESVRLGFIRREEPNR